MALGLMFCCGNDFSGEEYGKKCRVFSLQELLISTNNLNYDNKIGEGSFGSVYWGQLRDGSQIAVKRLNVRSKNPELELSYEMEKLAKIRHKNLLSLRGYCIDGPEILIVHDFIPNLSLLYYLRVQQSAECVLEWSKRMNIAIGSAEGIAYLHHRAKPRITHGAIKPSNILLDSDFQPKVSDFGLTKFIPNDKTRETTTNAKERVRKSEESNDVYSFGILLLELVSGKRAIIKKVNPDAAKWSIYDWAGEENLRDIADPKLSGKFEEKELRRVVLVALMSAQKQAEKRPTMLEVVELLKGRDEDKLVEFEIEFFKGRGEDNLEDCRDLNPE